MWITALPGGGVWFPLNKPECSDSVTVDGSAVDEEERLLSGLSKVVCSAMEVILETSTLFLMIGAWHSLNNDSLIY